MMTHPPWLAQNLMTHPFVRAQNLMAHPPPPPPILIDQSLMGHLQEFEIVSQIWNITNLIDEQL